MQTELMLQGMLSLKGVPPAAITTELPPPLAIEPPLPPKVNWPKSRPAAPQNPTGNLNSLLIVSNQNYVKDMEKQSQATI